MVRFPRVLRNLQTWLEGLQKKKSAWDQKDLRRRLTVLSIHAKTIHPQKHCAACSASFSGSIYLFFFYTRIYWAFQVLFWSIYGSASALAMLSITLGQDNARQHCKPVFFLLDSSLASVPELTNRKLR